MQLQGGSSAVFAPLWRIWLCVAPLPLRAVGPTPAQDEERDTQSHTS